MKNAPKLHYTSFSQGKQERTVQRNASLIQCYDRVLGTHSEQFSNVTSLRFDSFLNDPTTKHWSSFTNLQRTCDHHWVWGLKRKGTWSSYFQNSVENDDSLKLKKWSPFFQTELQSEWNISAVQQEPKASLHCTHGLCNVTAPRSGEPLNSFYRSFQGRPG